MARAKQTNRAEARRRHRQAQAQLTADEGTAEEGQPASDSGAARQGASGRQGSGSPGRPSLGAAFRGAYRPAHLREDLAALPGLLVQAQPATIPLTRTVIRVPWFLVSAALVVIGFGALLTSPNAAISVAPASSPAASAVATTTPSAVATGPVASGPVASEPAASGPVATVAPTASGTPTTPEGQSGGIGGLLFQLLSLPPGGPTLPILLVGFTATRASYLLGLLIGLLDLLLVGIYVAVVPSATSTTTGVGDILLTAAITGLPTSVLFAGAAAWYRRFLQLSSPRRAQPARQAGRGRSGGRSTSRR